MLSSTRVLGATLLAILLAGCAEEGDETQDGNTMAMSSASSGLQGAWRIVELRRANGATAENPASLFLFGGDQYSIMYAHASTARATFAIAPAPTDAEARIAFDSFTANAGRYTVVADTLTIRPVIAKNPNYMGGGENRYTLRITGDTLWLREVPGAFRWAAGQAPAAADTATASYRLLRLQ